ncbi:hypothetical protein [Hymenobacter bucti]|uniref:Uncharacterized protein n=1 Tax=Hymenobacter bucti TaxID=1844114 RepID=A0ABW4QUK4_9BACT
MLRYEEAVKQQKADHSSAVADAKIKAEKDKQAHKAPPSTTTPKPTCG